MGSQSVKEIKTQKDRKEFVKHLLNDVKTFEYMIENNLFENDIQRIGAEQELCIVDKNYRPSNKALEILDKIEDSHYTTELALFNLEVNLDPLELKESCFSNLENRLNSLLLKGYKASKEIDESKIILSGILPTLRKKDLIFKNVTPFKRYKTLNNVLKKIKGDDFKLYIQGVDELILKHKSILFEACNTSFQVHLQINPNKAIDMYNWSQAIAGPVLSLMCNSPMLLGKELWSETRIALFQQSIDLRNTSHFSIEQKPRVSFGYDWVKNSIVELFTDDISRYPALVSSTFKENSLHALKNGIMPKLKALNLHNGTLYKWNRLCYGVHNNLAHLRIENRYIPSGPSVKDEIANAMLWIGVMQGMPKDCEQIWKKMPFKDARGNFKNAARTGMNSYFTWFGKGISAKKMAETILLPMAKRGLLKSNINEKEIEYYLGIIKKRIEKNITGSKWIIKNKRALRKKVSKYETNVILTEQMFKNQQLNTPVTEWKPIKIFKNDIQKKYDKVYKIMSSELFVVHEHDLIEMALHIMNWKNIHHLPVVNTQNETVGILNKKSIQNLDFTKEKNKNIVAKKLMLTDFEIVHTEASFEEVKEIFKRTQCSCLVVINDDDCLAGLLTKNDLKRIKSLQKKQK